jgi:hypothetical protein
MIEDTSSSYTSNNVHEADKKQLIDFGCSAREDWTPIFCQKVSPLSYRAVYQNKGNVARFPNMPAYQDVLSLIQAAELSTSTIL